MALFDDVDQKLSNWINAGTDKAKGMSESMKISGDIKEEEKNQEDLYRQIGLHFYNNYAETAEKFSVSYQQARNYTVKYENSGVDALQDNRGRRKPEDALTEIEKLRAELKLEKAKRQKAEMEVSFLKKLEEIERRRG